MAYGDLKCRNLIWNSGSGDNTIVLSTLLTSSSPSWTGTATGVNLTLSGDLTVNGTTTTINTTTLQVEDKNVEIGKVSSPSDTTADGGGWTLLGATNKTFNWVNATDAWTSSEHIQVASGKTFIGDGSTLTALNASNLASGTVATARLGTGTASASTFLLGNGVWTSTGIFAGTGGGTQSGDWSWQDQSSNVYFRLLSGGDGTVEIKHGAKLSVFNDSPVVWGNSSELQIEHDSTSNKSLIQATTSDPLEFQLNGGDLNFTYVAGGSAHTGATWDAGGAWSFAHGSSTKLATTSTGIDVTGEIKVNGAALSAAPEITATADGAIAAGQSVIMKSDGDVTKVKRVITINNPPTTVADRTQITANDFDRMRAYYIPELKKIIIGGKNESSGDDMEVIVGEVADDGSFTWGSITQIGTDRAYSTPAFVYDPDTERVILVYACDGMSSPEYSIFSNVLTISGNAVTNVGTRQTIEAVDGYADNGVQLVYDTTANKVVVIYRRGGGNNLYYSVGTVTGSSTNTISWGTAASVASGEIQEVGAVYDPNTDRIIATRRTGYTTLDAYVGTLSGTSITWGSNSQIAASGAGGYHEICYDTEAQRVVVVYKDGNSDLVAKVGTITGGSTNSISWGSVTSAWYPNSAGSNSGGRCLFDPYTKRVAVHTIGDGSGYKLYTASGLVSGSSITWTNRGTQEGDRVTEGNAQDFVVADKGRVVSIYRNFDRSNDLYCTSGVLGTGASNMTTSNFVGFAKAAANDNATATVDVTGSTNSSQSSLTPGLGYYVQDDGTLGTTASDPEQFAGTAIAATKLLVRGYPPAAAGVGEWTKLLSGDKAYSATTHDFVEGFDTTYAAYKWFKIVWHFVGDGASSQIGVRVKSGGSYKGNNQYNRQNISQTNGNSWSANNNSSNNQPAAMFNAYAFHIAQGETEFFNPMGTDVGMSFVTSSEGWYADSGSGTTGTVGTQFKGRDRCISSWGTSYGAITGLQWYVESGNIRNMYWVLYGRN